MIWSINGDVCLTYCASFAPVIRIVFSIERVFIPVPTIARVNSRYACLNDGIKADEARKFRDVDRRSSNCDAHASRVNNRVLFRMADSLQFFINIFENFFIVIHSAWKPVKSSAQYHLVR